MIINPSAYKNLFLGVCLAAASLLAGCSNVGNAPEGPTADQVQAELAKQDPQQQIVAIQHSPIPFAEKEKKIQEIEKKYGITRKDGDAPTGPGR